MKRGKTFWTCLECGHQVYDAALRVAAPAWPGSADLEKLPSGLALPWWEFRREAHAVMRLHRLCDTAEILTRFLTIVALGELRAANAGSLLPEVLNAVSSQIERPTFGQWRDMLRALVARLPDAPVFSELAGFVQKELLSRMDSHGAEGEEAARHKNIVVMHNAAVHGGPMSEQSARKYLNTWEPWKDCARRWLFWRQRTIGPKLLPYTSWLTPVHSGSSAASAAIFRSRISGGTPASFRPCNSRARQSRARPLATGRLRSR